MKQLISTTAHSLKDFRILPGYTDENCRIADISLRSRLCRKRDDFIFLDLPFLSSAMRAVTNTDIAIALAELGGAGVIPLHNSVEEQCEKVKKVKHCKAGFQTDLVTHTKYPNASVDSQKRLRIGAAVSTHIEDKQRVKELVGAEADFLVIDSSDGFSVYQKRMIEWIKKDFDIPVIGGNTVTPDAFRMLVEAGADAVKIGIGVGSGCITSGVKAIGRGLATAVMEIVEIRDRYADKGKYIPLIADGGINLPSDIAIALAMGADVVMMGNYFARFAESPGTTHNLNGRRVKEYWMEGSMRGYNLRRYSQSEETFFEEGIDGYVPLVGSIYDLVPVSRKRLAGTLSSTGASNMDEFRRLAVLEVQSPLARADGMIHDIIEHPALKAL